MVDVVLGEFYECSVNRCNIMNNYDRFDMKGSLKVRL
jgi:hypothetical protein